MTLGARSSAAMTADGHLLIFNRGDNPLIDVGSDGRFVRSFGEGLFMRPLDGNTINARLHTFVKK